MDSVGGKLNVILIRAKTKTLQLYDETKSVTKVITCLGYPTRRCLYHWLWMRKASAKPQKERKRFINTDNHPLHPSIEIKLEILHRCFELGENVKLVSEETGYSRASIYVWRRRYIREGRLALMNSSDIPRDNLKEGSLESSQEELVALKRKIHDMQLEMETALLTRSMSRKGCSPDNSACEGFWGRLKNEMFYPGCWTETSIEDFMNEVDGYIRWYN